MSKDAEAFRTISEVAEELRLPQHVLRFWETKFPQLKPLKRGGNRRYYRPDDVDLLRAIRKFLYSDGYTIKGVQRMLREQGPRSVAVRARTANAPLASDIDGQFGPAQDPPNVDKPPIEAEPEASGEVTPILRRLGELARELDSCAALLAAASASDPLIPERGTEAPGHHLAVGASSR